MNGPLRIIVLGSGDPLEVVNDAPPLVFRLFKMGANPTSKGTFYLTPESGAQVMADFAQQGNDLAFDWRHELVAPDVDPGQKRPGEALGWFVPELRADGLYAVVKRWTAEALKLFADKKVRYFSPAFSVNKDNEVTALTNCALTNLPATQHQQPLVAAEAATKGTMMILDESKKPALTKLGRHVNSYMKSEGTTHAKMCEEMKCEEGHLDEAKRTPLAEMKDHHHEVLRKLARHMSMPVAHLRKLADGKNPFDDGDDDDDDKKSQAAAATTTTTAEGAMADKKNEIAVAAAAAQSVAPSAADELAKARAQIQAEREASEKILRAELATTNAQLADMRKQRDAETLERKIAAARERHILSPDREGKARAYFASGGLVRLDEYLADIGDSPLPREVAQPRITSEKALTLSDEEEATLAKLIHDPAERSRIRAEMIAGKVVLDLAAATGSDRQKAEDAHRAVIITARNKTAADIQAAKNGARK